MHVTTNITISELINKIVTTPAGQEEPLLQLLDKFIAELDRLSEDQYNTIWQAMMDTRIANAKFIEICECKNLLDPQMPKCRRCKAALIYIASQELKKAQEQLDKLAESI